MEASTPRQRQLFDDEPALNPIDPHVEDQDRGRLAGQNAVILARLQQGPATNVELADLSLKYTSRISDLRAAGYRIACRRIRRGGPVFDGLTEYTLEHDANSHGSRCL